MTVENYAVDAFLLARENLRTLLDTVSCGDGADARVIDLRGEVWGLVADECGNPCLHLHGARDGWGFMGRADTFAVGALTIAFVLTVSPARDEMYVLTTAMRDDGVAK